jgi:hypothetical protein
VTHANRHRPRIEWPGGHRFAFTIFDDTDRTTLENGPPVYELFGQLGMRVTKSVWPSGPTEPQRVGGTTCADPAYLEWVLTLQAGGHEIGYHNATDHPSTRARTIEALDQFAEMFGAPPRVGADHSGNQEALYWGPQRLSGLNAAAYGASQRILRPNRPEFSGEDPTSEYFWGDLCRDRITYWRNFTFSDVDLLGVFPKVPYHDPRRPYVNYWFTSTDAPKRATFVERLRDDALDRLEDVGGVCIMYTHLGVGFASDGQVDPSFARAMERLAARSVWVAPVSEVLDHMRSYQADTLLTDRERAKLERAWILDRVRHSPFLRTRRAAAHRQ